jgi:hypothetical protein
VRCAPSLRARGAIFIEEKAMIRTLAAALAVAMLLPCSDALAVVQRTFVSAAGNDANTAANCSIVSPCRSFTSALSVTQTDGEIVVLDSGGFGRVTVDRSVTIAAPSGVYAGISVFPATNGVDINTGSINVVLRGLTINGQGGTTGVSFLSGNSLTIENCVVSNMNGAGIDAAAPSADVRVKDTTLRGNSGYGIDARNSLDRLSLDGVRIEGGSSPGMRVTEGAHAFVANTRVDGNNAGVHVFAAAGATTSLTMVNTVISGNNGDGLYVFASGASTHAGVSLLGGAITGQGTNGVRTDSSTGATVYVSISNAAITDNGSVGIYTVSGAGTRVSASANTITRNALHGLRNDSATLLSRQDNTVHDNNSGGAQTLGTITALFGI